MKKGAIATVYLVIFLDMLGFGVLIPVVRDLTQVLVKNSGLTWPRPEIYMGLLMAVYSGSQMLSAPILGRLSDYFGRKPIFILSTAGNVLSYVIWILANDYWFFLVGRVLSGITGGNIAIAQSIIADNTTPQERPKAMGLLGAAIGMGFVIGPFLGGWMINFNHIINAALYSINAFWIIGAMCLVLAFVSLIMIIFSRYGTNNPNAKISSNEGFAIIASALRSPVLRLTYNAHLLSQLAFVIFEVLFAWILQHQYNFDLKETFYFFGLQGLILAFIQGGVYRRIEKSHPPEYWVKMGLLGSFIGMAIIPWVGYVDMGVFLGHPLKIYLLLVVLVILSLAVGFGGPSINAYASIHSPENEQGRTMGNMQGLAALARFTAPVVATTLYAQYLPIPFLLGALLSIAAWIIFSQEKAQHDKK